MIFTVHLPEKVKPGVTAFAEAAVFVPEANAKWALIFGPFWLAFHRLWWPLAFYIPIAAICLIFITYGYNLGSSLLAALPGLFLLFEGNELRRNDLERREYGLIDVVEAPDITTAEELFFSGFLGESNLASDRDPPTSATVTTREGKDEDLAFGLFPEGNA